MVASVLAGRSTTAALAAPSEVCAGRVYWENVVTQIEADHEPAAAPRAATAAPHHHLHRQHYRHSAISLLGASVFTRLAIVAGVSVVLWIAIVWALA
jgi:hypothetical protein